LSPANDFGAKKIELWIGYNERRVIESSASNECVGGHVFWW
jgi:hypothetical protein